MEDNDTQGFEVDDLAEQAESTHPLAFLPNLLTIGNGACGFAAIYQLATLKFVAGAPVMVNPENISHACWLLVLAALFDGVDGAVARLTHTDGEFGGQLDSLCDAVSFGVAPGMLIAMLNTQALTNPIQATMAQIGGGVFMACALLRLARFNVENTHTVEDHMHFKGLPSPGAAAVVVSLLFLYSFLAGTPWLPAPVPSDLLHQLAGVVAAILPFIGIVLGALMVSSLRYPDLRLHYICSRHPHRHLALIPLAAALLAPPIILPVLLLCYTLFVPLHLVWQRVTEQLAARTSR